VNPRRKDGQAERKSGRDGQNDEDEELGPFALGKGPRRMHTQFAGGQIVDIADLGNDILPDPVGPVLLFASRGPFALMVSTG